MSAPTLQPIAEWLEKLGLRQYPQRFVENEIDVSVVRHLTDQDGALLSRRSLARRHHGCYPSRQFGVHLAEFLRSPSSPMGGKRGYRIGYRH